MPSFFTQHTTTAGCNVMRSRELNEASFLDTSVKLEGKSKQCNALPLTTPTQHTLVCLQCGLVDLSTRVLQE